MKMEDGEILRSYKEAKNKFKQVGILAELNCVSKQEMAQWLKDHDQEVARNFWRKKAEEEVAEDEPIDTDETECMLSMAQAYSVAAFIDAHLFRAIRDNTDWDNLQALKNILYAYDEMCRVSGYGAK